MSDTSTGGGAPEPAHPWLLPRLLRDGAHSDDDAYSDPGAHRRRTVRDWCVDSACFLLTLLTAAPVLVGEYFANPPVPPPVTVLDTAGAVLAGAAIWVRRRWPVPVAVILTLLSVGIITVSTASGIAAFTVAVHRRFPVAAAVTLLGIGSAMAQLALRLPAWLPYWPSVLVAILLSVVALGWGMFVRARRQLMLSMADRARRAEDEQRTRVREARRAERTRIAREMHDVLAHRITLLGVHAGALEYRPDAPPADLARAAGIVRTGAHQALQDLREIIGLLRDDDTDDPADSADRPRPDLTDLPDLLDESRQAGATIDLGDTTGDLTGLPPGAARAGYRIVQEALTNARKHAPDRPITIHLSGAAGSGLTIEIRNPTDPRRDGVPAAPGSGTGLVGLTERAELAGGTLTHGSTPTGEFRLSAWLPWPA